MNRPGATPAPTTAPGEAARRETRAGLFFALGAYLWWGFFPLYLKLLTHVPALLVVAHRVVWSLAFLLAILTLQRRLPELRAAARSRRHLALLALGAALIGVNWFAFIYAVETDRVVQASLGYYINPLISVLLGMIALGERLRAGQWVAVALAAAGVLNLALRGEQFPWIALTVATSFAFYGLVRKFVPVGPLISLSIETAVLTPLAAALVLAKPLTETQATPATYALLALSGVVTAIPLLWFAAAARRLRLSTIGFLQYIGPTCQFLLATLVLGETLQPATLVSFAAIWAALAVYSLDALRAHRAPQPPPVELAE